MNELDPYPSYYCPDGVDKPTHCPHTSAMRPLPGMAPDGGSGLVYGTHYDADSKPRWLKTSGGWWILLEGKRPQDLLRLTCSQRVLRWHVIAGAEIGQVWRIPVLLTLSDAEKTDSGYVTAVDRILSRGEWIASPEIVSMQERLLAIAQHIALDDDLSKRNAAVTVLTIELMQVGHLVARCEIEAAGWLAEFMQLRVIFAALDRIDLINDLNAAIARDAVNVTVPG